MWYETLPCLVIIGGLMYSYQLVGGALHKAAFGMPFRRCRNGVWERSMCQRDERIAGVCWKNAGLENIPDA